MSFDLNKLFGDVFYIEPNESVLVLTDVPHGSVEDNPYWRERRIMAAEWHNAFVELSRTAGFSVLPLTTYPAATEWNRQPDLKAGSPFSLEEALSKATLAVSFSENSISATLLDWTKKHDDFRAASLPSVARRMESTALSADYADIALRCRHLAGYFKGAQSANVRFSTGHELIVDIRFRSVYLEDGQLPRNKVGGRLINLPSGEVCIAPFEGVSGGEASLTRGDIPVSQDGEVFVLGVRENRIRNVIGSGRQAKAWRTMLAEDEARANIAELGLGCNPFAVVWGNILEDEKAGFHWAYGRNDYFGGNIGVSAFKSLSTVVHKDIIYAKDSPIQADAVTLKYVDGSIATLIKNKNYIVF